MFANSLDMITNPKDRDNIYHQLDRLEEKLIKLTNELYEEEYVTLLNRKTSLLDEEKTRITKMPLRPMEFQTSFTLITAAATQTNSFP